MDRSAFFRKRYEQCWGYVSELGITQSYKRFRRLVLTGFRIIYRLVEYGKIMIGKSSVDYSGHFPLHGELFGTGNR